MRDANRFLDFLSFGNLMIEESRFINALRGAVRLAFVGENLTPNQTTIRNCLFQNNSIETMGSAFYFEGRTKTRDQFPLNILFINNTFLNNQARCKI